MKELYKFDNTKTLTARFMVPMRAGQRTGIDIQALLGRGSVAFVNISVTTPKGYTVSVNVLVYRYVVTPVNSFATVNNMMYRFPQPPDYTPQLKVAHGDTNMHVDQMVSGSDYIFVL
jgi:hypothetical protein